MENKFQRVEIVVTGLVQGVGFRYYVYRLARQFGFNGFVKNLFSGEVFIVAEGPVHLTEEFYNKVKIGPMHAQVKKAVIKREQIKNEFTSFEIRY